MMYSLKRYESGFTIIEIIAVLLLLSIVAATVMGRAISTERLDLTSQMDKIRNHYRYAHSMAMKYGDAVWGFKRSADKRYYWVFRLEPPITNPITEPDDLANHVMLPGEQNLKVDMHSKGVEMLGPDVYFDRFGRPYVYYKGEGDPTNLPFLNMQTFHVYNHNNPAIDGNLEAYPETGLIR